MRHVLGVLGSESFSLDTFRLECTVKIEISQDVLDWLDMHDVEIDSLRQRIYIYNQLKYIYLGPKLVMEPTKMKAL
jgi:hypothetical protein